MELSLSSLVLQWIDTNRQAMSRQAFIRQLIYDKINATSGEEIYDREATRTDANGYFRLRNED